MADKLTFTLVSPERELFSDAVHQVDLPGTEGDLGVLPHHAPLMAAIRTGVITIYNDGGQTVFFVRGGFADVTPEGLTVLAEQAMPLSEVSVDMVKADIETAQSALEGLEGDAALLAQQNLDGLNQLSTLL